MTVRVRLAPSPTGTLHIGTARTALFNWLFARKKNGKFLIRIEDTDKERSKSEFTDNILKGLQWLGLDWDQSPILQSKRIKDHRLAIKYLLDKGLAYRCYTTEEELEKMREKQISNNQAPRYDNRHRDLSPEQELKFINEKRSSVIRFRIDDYESIQWNDLVRGKMNWLGKDLGGDMVISRRAESNEIGDPLYNLVVVVDDSYMEITHVIRGEDHIANTAKQLLLYKALNLNPPIFAHTPLILNTDGKKLSKRDGVTSIEDFKAMGYTPEALANYMTLLGWSPEEENRERFTINEASNFFSLDRVNKAGAKFNWEKLNWLNSQVIHEWEPEKLFKEIEPIMLKKGLKLPEKEWCVDLAELIGPSLTLINDCIDETKVFFEEPHLEKDAIDQLSLEGAKECLKLLLEELSKSPWDGLNKNDAKQLINNVVKNRNIKKGLIMKSLRAALLGSLTGPDLLSSWALLARIKKDQIRIKRVL